MEGKSGSETRLLASRDILLKACKFDNSLAISAGDEGDDPSSLPPSLDNGICEGSCGGGDGGRNRGLVRVGLFRCSADGVLLSEDKLR